MDYIMKEFLFANYRIISFCSQLKLSVDIFVMSVMLVFAEFWFIFVKRQKAHLVLFFYLFILFYKSNVLLIL